MSLSALPALIAELKRRQQTISFAESCTGGLLSAQLVAYPDISDIFMGSIVSYGYQAKMDLLKVSSSTLQKEGAVSREIAAQMAQGARRELKSDWAVAITGIAGPSGGTPDKPVGTVWFAVSGPGFEEQTSKLLSGSRNEIQQASVQEAVELLCQCLRLRQE